MKKRNQYWARDCTDKAVIKLYYRLSDSKIYMNMKHHACLRHFTWKTHSKVISSFIRREQKKLKGGSNA